MKGIVKIYEQENKNSEWKLIRTQKNLIVNNGEGMLRDYLSGAGVFRKDNLLTNLISYYKLDEFSGTVAYDSHGLNNGTANNARVFTTCETGIINTCADFGGNTPGDEDYIEIPDSETFSASTRQMTWSFWYNENGATPAISMLCKSDGANNQSWRINVLTAGTERYFYLELSSDGTSYDGDSIYLVDGLSDTTWYHVVLTFDNGVIKMYLDGVEKTALSSDSNPFIFKSVGQPIWIGKDYTYDNTGLIDEVAMWSRALTQEEVLQLYNDGDCLQYPFIKDEYKYISSFGVGTGTTAPVGENTDLETPILYDGTNTYKTLDSFTEDDFKTITFIGYLTVGEITTETNITEIVLCSGSGEEAGTIYCRATFDPIPKDSGKSLKIEYTQVI